MSQEKVNARKEYKKNRKEILAKEKRKKAIGRFTGYLAVLVIVVGVGFSFYKKIVPDKEPNVQTFSYLSATHSYGIFTPSLPEGE